MDEEKIFDPYIIDEYLFDLQADSPATRLQAFQKLLDFVGHEPVRLELRKFCFREIDSEVRHFALRHFNLINLRPVDDEEPVIDWLDEKSGKSTSLRLEILEEKLGLIDDPAKKVATLRKAWASMGKDVLDVLARRVSADTEPVFLAYAMGLMGHSRNPEHHKAVSALLTHSDSRVRANAVEALGQMGCQNLVSLLEKFLVDCDNRIRANAIIAVFSVDPGKAVAALRVMAQSPLESHRDSALYCLSQIPAEQAGEITIKMFERETIDFLCFKQANLLQTMLLPDYAPMLSYMALGSNASPVKRGLSKKMLAHLTARYPQKSGSESETSAQQRVEAKAAPDAEQALEPETCRKTLAESESARQPEKTSPAVAADEVAAATLAAEDESPEPAEPAAAQTLSEQAAEKEPVLASAATLEDSPGPELETPEPRLIEGALKYNSEKNEYLKTAPAQRAVAVPVAAYVPPSEGRPVRVRQSKSRSQREVELLPETFMERQIVSFLAFYQKKPKLAALLCLIFLVAVASAFIYTVMPLKQPRVLPKNRPWLSFAGSGSNKGIRRSNTTYLRHRLMSIKGVVKHIDDLWVHVQTNGALYKLSFLDQLPEGCCLDAQVEARGLYAGYCFASRAVELNCEKFYVYGPARRRKDR